MSIILEKEYSEIRELFNDLNRDGSHFDTSNDICTPMECVEEMVDKIPKDFFNDNIKILDPCAGNGNFFGYIVNCFENKSRALQNNLYFNEINDRRISNIKKIFGDKLNITEIDFLQYPEDNLFDLVVANPPYAKFTNGERAAKNHNLSRDFIKKALTLTNVNGYILFIVPDNWMSLSDRNDVVFLLSEYQFIYLNIHKVKKYFPKVGSSFTYFLIQKKDNTEEFMVENGYNRKSEISWVSINKNSFFIPLYYNKLVKSIMEKTLFRDDVFNIKTSSNLHKYTKSKFIFNEQNDEFKYRLFHTPKQVVWSSVPHKYQDGWKVFISLTDTYKVFIDKDCGMTQSIAFILCETESEASKIATSLSHPLYIFLNNICRFGNFNNVRVLQKFPRNKTDNIFEDFGISEEEAYFIINFLKKE